MKYSKLIAVLLLGVMMFGTIQPACAETAGQIIGEFVSIGVDIFAEGISVLIYGDPSSAWLVQGASNGIGDAVGTAVDWVISWFE